MIINFVINFMVFYFSAIFEKSTIFSRQELSFNHISEECLIFKDLQLIRHRFDQRLFQLQRWKF